MLSIINGRNTAALYQTREINAQDNTPSAPMPDNVSENTNNAYTVDIKSKARELKQQYNEKHRSLEDQQKIKEKNLQTQFNQEKQKLEQEYRQKKQQLNFSVYA